MCLLKKLLEGRIGVWLRLYPVFAADENDQKRIIEAAQFQPNDVY